jgi:hypothetical protein
MRPEDRYRHWVQARTRVDISPDFAERVMGQIRGQRKYRHDSGLRRSRLVQRIAASSWTKAAAIAMAAIIGIGRILLTFHLLLFA